VPAPWFAFPRPMADEPGYDFSYSGLKTAVALAAQKHPERGADLAASFEAAATDVLIATFCAEEGHELLHNDRDFDFMAKHLGLKVAKTG